MSWRDGCSAVPLNSGSRLRAGTGWHRRVRLRPLHALRRASRIRRRARDERTGRGAGGRPSRARTPRAASHSRDRPAGRGGSLVRACDHRRSWARRCALCLRPRAASSWTAGSRRLRLLRRAADLAPEDVGYLSTLFAVLQRPRQPPTGDGDRAGSGGAMRTAARSAIRTSPWPRSPAPALWRCSVSASVPWHGRVGRWRSSPTTT